MTSQVFADGVSRIRVVNGTVRMEFVSSVEGDAGKTVLEPQVRVVMSMKGFAAACQTMQQAMAALISNGTIVMAPPAAKARGTVPARASARKPARGGVAR